MKIKVFHSPIAVVMVCFALYLSLSFASWSEPIMGDEVTVAMAARAINEPGLAGAFRIKGNETFGVWHPPGYFHLLALTWKLAAGPRELTGRLPGIICFLLSLFLLYRIAYTLPGSETLKRAAAAVSCLLFAVNPLAARGSLLVDMDGSLLSLMALLFIYAMMATRKEDLSVRRIFILGMLFCALLWSKLTAPAIIIACLLVNMAAAGDGRYFRLTLKIAALGAALFVLSWLAYSRVNGVNPAIILAVPLSVAHKLFAAGGGEGGVLSVLRNSWTLAVWASPAFLILSIMAIIRCMKGRHRRDSFFTERDLAVYAFAVVVIYHFVGGVTHSFPKYHYAAIPVCAILVGRLLAAEAAFEVKHFPLWLVICAFPAYAVFFIGDPLLAVNYTLKELTAFNKGTGSVTAEAAVVSFFLVLPVLLAVSVYRKQRRTLLGAVCVCALSANIVLSLRQQTAPYNTVYCYGARGVRRTAALVSESVAAGQRIIAPPEILWLADKNPESYLAAGAYADSARFLQEISEAGAGAVVYGITGNTVEQYHTVFIRPDILKMLHQKYECRGGDSYTIWLRR